MSSTGKSVPMPSSNARILSKSNARVIGLGFVFIALGCAYQWATQATDSPIFMGLITLAFGFFGVSFLVKNTQAMLYIDQGQLVWYSYYGKKCTGDSLALTSIRALKETRARNRRSIVWIVTCAGDELELPSEFWHARKLEQLQQILASYNPAIGLERQVWHD